MASMFQYQCQSSNTWQKYFAHSVLLNHQNYAHTSSQPALCYVCTIYNITNYVQILS